MILADYLLPQEGHDWSNLLAAWGPELPQDFTLWMVNRLGDLIMVFPDESVHMLDVGSGCLSRIAKDRNDFIVQIDLGNNANEWLAIPLVDACVKAGMTLQGGECYGYKIPPMLGGSYEVDNLEPTDLSVHYSLLADIHRQTKDLPDGTKIDVVTSE